ALCSPHHTSALRYPSSPRWPTVRPRSPTSRCPLSENQLPTHEKSPRCGGLCTRPDGRLPDHYRGVVVLCDLEGLTRKEAARQRGSPPNARVPAATRHRCTDAATPAKSE